MFLYVQASAAEVILEPAKSDLFLRNCMYILRQDVTAFIRSLRDGRDMRDVYIARASAVPSWSEIYRHLLRFNRGEGTTRVPLFFLFFLRLVDIVRGLCIALLSIAGRICSVEIVPRRVGLRKN